MLQINAEEVGTLGLEELSSRLDGPVDQLAASLLAVSNGCSISASLEGSALAEALVQMHERALAEVIDLLPAPVIEYFNADLFERCRWWLLSDHRGTFCSVFEGSQALIGTADEIAGVMSQGAMGGARRVIRDPASNNEARHRAAVLLRSLRPVAVVR